MLGKNSLVHFLLGVFVGGFVIYSYFQPKLEYQGKTAKQWADDYGNLWSQSVQQQLNSGQIYFPGLASPSPTPVYSNTQNFMNTCGYGSIYCTCLYDVLHRIDSGNEVADYISYNKAGNNAPMINAYAECNSRFNSK